MTSTFKAIVSGTKLGESEFGDEYTELTLKIYREVPEGNEKKL